MCPRLCLLNPCSRIAALLVAAAFESAAPSLASGPQPDALPGEEVKLRAVPELKAVVRGEFLRPTALDLLNALRSQTGLNLALDKSVIHDRPIQGHTKFSAPAWGAMEQLAGNQWVLGRWRKIGDEYRLFATYDGPPPPLPPEVPPQLVRMVMANSQPPPQARPPAPHEAAVAPLPFWQRRNVWITGSLTAAVCLMVVASLWVRRHWSPGRSA